MNIKEINIRKKSGNYSQVALYVVIPRGLRLNCFHVPLNVVPLKQLGAVGIYWMTGGFHVPLNVVPLKQYDIVSADGEDELVSTFL